jgi:hypothetical protein
VLTRRSCGLIRRGAVWRLLIGGGTNAWADALLPAVTARAVAAMQHCMLPRYFDANHGSARNHLCTTGSALPQPAPAGPVNIAVPYRRHKSP